MKMLYIVTKGTDDDTLASVPLRELLRKLREHEVPVQESLAAVSGTWASPPDLAQRCAEADKVVTF